MSWLLIYFYSLEYNSNRLLLSFFSMCLYAITWWTAVFASSRFLLRCLEIQQAVTQFYLQVSICRKPLRIILQNVSSRDVVVGALYHITVRAPQAFPFAVEQHSSRAVQFLCRHLKRAFPVMSLPAEKGRCAPYGNYICHTFQGGRWWWLVWRCAAVCVVLRLCVHPRALEMPCKCMWEHALARVVLCIKG